ncbi:hypothetical protein, partial [Streptomyces sp. NPDC002758]
MFEEGLDPLGLDRRLIMHTARPDRAGPQSPALSVGDDGGLLGVLPHLAGHERTPAGAARL